MLPSQDVRARLRVAGFVSLCWSLCAAALGCQGGLMGAPADLGPGEPDAVAAPDLGAEGTVAALGLFLRDWDGVLARLSTEGACLDWLGLRHDGAALAALRRASDRLATIDPGALPQREQRLALWLNAHNLCLVEGILDGMAQDLAYAPDAAGMALFRRQRCRVGGQIVSLDAILQGALRGDEGWGLRDPSLLLAGGRPDPRIHAAVYLGTRFGPPLRRAPYVPEGLEQALDGQARRWLAQPLRGAGPEGISYLFLWYAQDFERGPGGSAGFVRGLRDEGLGPVDLLHHLPFGWTLDQQDATDPLCREGAARCEPSQEVCDGLDDDCDGLTDEDLGPPPEELCPRQGVCREGATRCAGAAGWVCDLPPSYEDPESSCDGLDNDCDGLTDEDLNPARAGCNRRGVCARAPAPECLGAAGWSCPSPEGYEAPERSCDGLDNDCDGRTDDVAEAPPGVCATLGVCAGAAARCEDGAWVCSYPASYEPAGETLCDGLDNNCDGATDEEVPDCGCVNQERRDCGLRLGACLPGVQFCWLGQWSQCSGLEPVPEICDGRDNDCDGVTDELVPGCECSPYTRERCGVDVGRCYPGWRTCSAEGVWGPCEGGRAPEPEICDGWDNDCDGEADEAAELLPPAERSCRSLGVCAQQARLECAGGRWTCLYAAAYEPTERSCDGLDNDCDGLTDEDLSLPEVALLPHPAAWDDEECWAAGDWEGPQGCCPPRFRRGGCVAGEPRACCLFEICGDPEGRDDDCDGLPDAEDCGEPGGG